MHKLLLGILWLSSTSLIGSALLNYKYSFNVFEIDHWVYLGQIQAQNANDISNGFYITLISITIIILFGLYIILHHKHKLQSAPKQIILPLPQTYSKETEQTNNIIQMERPPRLNTSPGMIHQRTQPIMNVSPKNIAGEMTDIFKSNNYTVKTSPKIGQSRPDLFAIGSNETLWIGLNNATNDTMAAMKNVLNEIFTEVLEDIEIDIKLFNVNSNVSNPDNDFLYFSNIDNLKNYLTPNKSVDSDIEKDFETLIDHLIKYLNNTNTGA